MARPKKEVIPRTEFHTPLEVWKDRIEHSERTLAQYQNAWQAYIRQACRSYYNVGGDGFGTNWMYPEARNSVANTYIKDPEWIADNPNPEFKKSKRAIEKILTYLWNRFQWSEPIRKALYHAWFSGVGMVKISYIPSPHGLPNMPLTRDRIESMQRLLSDLGVGNLDEVEVARIIEGIGLPVEHNETQLRGFPFIQTIGIKNMIVDATIDELDLYRSRWIGESMWVPLDYVRKSPLYLENVRGKIEGETRSNFQKDDKAGGERGNAGDEKWVMIHEWYDKVNGLLITANLEQDKTLRAVPFDGVIPYDLISFNPVPTQYMPIPDAALVYPHALELDEIKSRISRILDRSRHQVLYDEEMIKDEKQLVPFLAGDDGAKIGVHVDRDAGQSLTDAVMFPNPISVPPELYRYSGELKDEIRVASGSSNTRSGTGGIPRTTATEIRARELGTDIRFGDKILALDHFLERIGTKVYQYVRNNWTPSMIAIISGERDNEEEVRDFNQKVEEALAVGQNPEDVNPKTLPRLLLRGDFIIRVRAGSTAPIDQQAEFQKDMLLFQMGLADPQVDNFAVTRWFLRKHGPDEAMSWLPPEQQAGVMQGAGVFSSVQGPTNPLAQPQQSQAILPQGQDQFFGQEGES